MHHGLSILCNCVALKNVKALRMKQPSKSVRPIVKYAKSVIAFVVRENVKIYICALHVVAENIVKVSTTTTCT